MDFSNYPSEVIKIIDDIEKQKIVNPELCLELCQKLIQRGEKEEDVSLLGVGYYNIADSYFLLNDYEHFVEYLKRGIMYQREASQWSILARSYNLLGVNATSQGNVTVALEQYFSGLRIAKRYNCEYETTMIYNNLGQVYMQLGEFERAVYYYLEAEQLLQKFQENSFGKRNLIVLYTVLGHCYLELENNVQAEETEQKIIKQMQGEKIGNVDMVLIQSFQAQLRYAQGRYEECDQYIAEVMKRMSSVQAVLEVWEDMFWFGHFLLNLKKYTEVELFFAGWEEYIEQIEITKLKVEFLRLKIRYYKEQGHRKKYLEACAELYEYREIQNKENLAILRHFADVWFSLEEAKEKEELLLKETEVLQKKAELDALTGLPNRYRLKEFAEELFEKAYREQRSFGIEILDVDYFKQYNDGYGHQKGDECLKAIAEPLIQMMEKDKNIFCARYGGDEFVILYYSKTDEEILHQAVLLRKSILEKRILHDYSPERKVVTISQGIHNTVPREQKGVWEYLHSADKALYQAKKCRKGSVCMRYEKDNDLVDTVVLASRRKNDI